MALTVQPRATRLSIGMDYRPAVLTSSGIGRSVRELARALARREEVDLHLFAHSWGRARRTDAPPSGARLHRLPIPGRGLPWLSRMRLHTPTLCGRVPLFHWTDYVHPPVGDGRVVLTLHDVAFAEDTSFHGEQTDELWERSRRAAARADVVVTPTRATADAAARALDLHPERITVVPFGADHVPDDVHDEPPLDDPYILSIGTIEPRKNHLRLVRAWKTLPAPRPVLVLIGRSGWSCGETAAVIEEERQRGGLIWFEGLPDTDMFRWLRHAQLLAYPSLLEGFGFPPLEALALRTPVVAGDNGALRETLGDAAQFCDPTDEESIAQALQAVLRDRTLRATLQARGTRQIADFTWEASAAGYARVYANALQP